MYARIYSSFEFIQFSNTTILHTKVETLLIYIL